MKYSKTSHSAFFAVILFSSILFAFQRNDRRNPSQIRMQTGIVVSDLEKSFEFYTKVLGMTKTGTYHVSPELATSARLSDNKAVDIIDLKLNNEPGNPEYKITKIQGVKSVPITNPFQPGSRYISLFVNDLQPYLKRIREHNIEMWSVTIPEGPRVLIFRDPDGALIEITGPPVKID